MAAKKRKLHKIKMDELSGVDLPAQKGADVLLMKRKKESEDVIAKRSFTEALEDLDIEQALRDTFDGMWEIQDALRQHVRAILADSEEYPNPKKSIQEALPQFAAAVIAQVTDAAEGLGSAIDGDAEEDTKTARSEVTNVNMKKKEKGKEGEAPNAEALQKSLDDNAKALEISKAYGELNDAEKVHYNSLEDEPKSEFIKMDSDARKVVLEELEKADSIVYTSVDGEVFRKSDDKRVVAMAKKTDEIVKNAEKDREERDTLLFAKRATDELGNLPGDSPVKVALLKAIDTIKDEEIRKGIGELLKASNDNVKGAFQSSGTSESPAIGKSSAESKFNTLVKKYQEENDNASKADAIVAVCETDEGAVLYEETIA